jgi:hypothetical protein
MHAHAHDTSHENVNKAESSVDFISCWHDAAASHACSNTCVSILFDLIEKKKDRHTKLGRYRTCDFSTERYFPF